jgi:hypothetical protein
MNAEAFLRTLGAQAPPLGLPATLRALWWDAKGDWARAHDVIDELETPEAMAVHAYLHRKEGADWNAEYWYQRSGKSYYRPALDAEWDALVEGLPGQD